MLIGSGIGPMERWPVQRHIKVYSLVRVGGLREVDRHALKGRQRDSRNVGALYTDIHTFQHWRDANDITA